jgi:regulatory protein
MTALDDELGTDPAQREFKAAAAYARRRRLGPYRAKDRDEHRVRDLASMARAGFAFDLARRIVDAKDPAALDEA